MAINYTKLAATVKRLIESNGKSLTLTKNSETPVDSDKPWRAAAPGTMDANITFATVIGVIVGQDFSNAPRDSFKSGVARALIAAESAVDNMNAALDLTKFDTLDDGTNVWSIVKVDPLEPGTVRLFYSLQLSQ